jgi:hypothetical protein
MAGAAAAARDASALERAVGELLSGARHTHEVAEMLVIEAVQETLARVCREYPLDYTQLVNKYQDDVVAQCCRLCETRQPAPAAKESCCATLKSGKPCSRRAIFGGYCGKHVEEFKAHQAMQRRKDAYIDTLARTHNVDAMALDLQKTSKNNILPMKLPTDTYML